MGMDDKTKKAMAAAEKAKAREAAKEAAKAVREKNKADKKKEAETREPVTEVPEFRDAAGNLFKYTRRDFPKSKEGSLGWCDYQIQNWTERKKQVELRGDPKKRKLDKLQKLREQLAELEKELGGEDIPEAEGDGE